MSIIDQLTINECKILLLRFNVGNILPKERLRVDEMHEYVKKCIEQYHVPFENVKQLVSVGEKKPKLEKQQQQQEKPKKPEAKKYEFDESDVMSIRPSENYGLLYIALGQTQKDVVRLRKQLGDFISQRENVKHLCRNNIFDEYAIGSLRRSEALIVLKTNDTEKTIIGFVCLEVKSDYIFLSTVCALGNDGTGRFLIDKSKEIALLLDKSMILLDAVPNVIFFYRKQGFQNRSIYDARIHRPEKIEISEAAQKLQEKMDKKKKLTFSHNNRDYNLFLQLLYDYEYSNQKTQKKLWEKEYTMVWNHGNIEEGLDGVC